jgi:hypothetical protein
MFHIFNPYSTLRFTQRNLFYIFLSCNYFLQILEQNLFFYNQNNFRK